MSTDNRALVHRDCTPCPANDLNDPQPCPLVGTGMHEPIENHLGLVHVYSQERLHGIRLAARVLGVPGAIDEGAAAMFKIHDFILLFQPAKEAP